MLTCWFYRRFISSCIDTDRSLPGQVESHLRHCAECRQFSDAGRQIAERLADEAQSESVLPPPFLHGKILASLNKPASQEAGGPFQPAWPAIALIFCLLLVGALFIRHRERLGELLQPAVSMAQATSNAIGLLAATAKIPSEEKLLEWSQKLDQPLETELQSVIHDARSALAGLAHNFLPDDLSSLR